MMMQLLLPNILARHLEACSTQPNEILDRKPSGSSIIFGPVHQQACSGGTPLIFHTCNKRQPCKFCKMIDIARCLKRDHSQLLSVGSVEWISRLPVCQLHCLLLQAQPTWLGFRANWCITNWSVQAHQNLVITNHTKIMDAFLSLGC